MPPIAALSSDEYFVPFGREPGSYLDVLGLNPSATNAEANRALVAYNLRVNADCTTACNEIRARFAANEISEAEQADEIEKQTAIKTQKLTDINTLKARHNSQVAERRKRENLGLPDDTATWMPMYRDLSDQSEATWNTLLRPQVPDSITAEYGAQLVSRWLHGALPWAIVPAGTHGDLSAEMFASLCAPGRRADVPFSQVEAQVQKRTAAARAEIAKRQKRKELTPQAAQQAQQELDEETQQELARAEQLYVAWHELAPAARGSSEKSNNSTSNNSIKPVHNQQVQAWLAEYKSACEQGTFRFLQRLPIRPTRLPTHAGFHLRIAPIYPRLPASLLSREKPTAQDLAEQRRFDQQMEQFKKDQAEFERAEAESKLAAQEWEAYEKESASYDALQQAEEKRVEAIRDEQKRLRMKLKKAGVRDEELKALESPTLPVSTETAMTKLVADRCAAAQSVSLAQWMALTAERDLLPCLIADALWSGVRYTDRTGWRSLLQEWNQEFAALGPKFGFKAGEESPGWLNLSQAIAHRQRTVQHLADGEVAVVADAPDRSRAQFDDNESEMAELLRRFLAELSATREETDNEA